MIYIQTQAGPNLLTRTNFFYEHIMNSREADKPCESSSTTTTGITGILLSGFLKHQVTKVLPINARANYAVNIFMLLNCFNCSHGLSLIFDYVFLPLFTHIRAHQLEKEIYQIKSRFCPFSFVLEGICLEKFGWR